MNRWGNQSRDQHQFGHHSKGMHQQQLQGSNPITPNNFPYAPTPNNRSKRVDCAHVCPDGHQHGTPTEVDKCIDAHKVYICSTNHLHTEKTDGERCDQIKREEEILRDKENQRKHEREMMDKQIKMADNLRAMGWNFKAHGMPQLTWKDS